MRLIFLLLTTACLQGITRETVLELCRDHDIAHEVANISLPEVYAADEVFCTGTMGELVSVITIDGKTIGLDDGSDCDGRPITKRLSSLFSKLTESEGYLLV
jgi:branched-chain amino acid aminotransferase